MYGRVIAACLAGVLLLAIDAIATEYPSKPIRLVVASPAGGPADRYARPIAQRVSEAVYQPVVVDNRPGATGNIGAAIVAKVPADGYTLLFGHSAIFGANPHVYRQVPFVPLKDFVAVAPVVKGYMFLYVPVSLPARNLQEFIALARKSPGALNYGSGGIGSIAHLTMESLKHKTSIDLVHIPHKGGSTVDVAQAMIRGDLSAAFEFYTPTMPQAKLGLRALAITSLKRNPAVPDIPTFAEQGVEGFEHYSWSGVFAPAGTPRQIIDMLNVEVSRARASPEVQQAIRDTGAIEMKGSPAEFAAFVRKEYERVGQLVKLAGVVPE